MMSQRHVDYLEHMLHAANDARTFVEGLHQLDFTADKRTQQAVILSLLIIGEAASKLLQNHSTFLAQHPELPWASMKGMRNRLAHGYFDIDLDVVWDTVHDALPQLQDQLPAIIAHALQEESRESGPAS